MKRFILSYKKNRIGIILMIFSAHLVAFGQLFWKLSEGSINKFLVIGFLLYGSGAVVMLLAYQKGSLSVLHPVLSFGYILSIFLGRFFFNESIGIMKLSGVIFIIIGVILIGGGDNVE